MDPSGMEAREWNDVVRSLEDISGFYETANLLMTFLQAPHWRAQAAALARGRVVEIGSGPGSFARLLPQDAVLIEPSPRLLMKSRELAPENPRARGRAEDIPLRDETADTCFCVFSFRDFLDKAKALAEMRRILTPGGRVVIVDVAKPPPGLRRTLMNLYIGTLIPHLIPFLAPRRERASWSGEPYREFARTYRAFGMPEQYAQALREHGFDEVRWSLLRTGGAFLLTGVRK